MESLSETQWDVVIEGTGLQQSLLALALSRSDKKVLHLDQSECYGGSEAAFSLNEAEEWAKRLAEKPSRPFSHVSLSKPESSGDAKLSPSRAYTLSLSPQIIYSKSKLLSQLVSSQVYRQLEFQAVGSWWICGDASDQQKLHAGKLKRLPNGREDVFSDRSIDVRAKRGLMKFLKFVIDFENQPDMWMQHADASLSSFLASQFQLPEALQNFIAALTLSLDKPTDTTVTYALPRIARHLTSIGVFGPGFGSVVPKWGGCAEIAQVACRAGAVGGAVYVLDTGVDNVQSEAVELALTNGENVKSTYYVSGQDLRQSKDEHGPGPAVSRSITVVSDSLSKLFQTTVEGAPMGAVAVVAFPAGSLVVDDESSTYPVYVMAHSADTGECPQNQCVLYASTKTAGEPKRRIEAAVLQLLESTVPQSIETDGISQEKVKVLFELYYEQRQDLAEIILTETSCTFPSSSLDLAFDDSMLDNVEDAWRHVMKKVETEESKLVAPYMVFKSREHFDEDDDE